MADADQDFMLNAIHMELQETNKLLRLLAEQMAAVANELHTHDQG
jgi:hypothetical protein